MALKTILTTCILATFLASGCASIVNGKHQTLSIDSNPSGAKCELLNDKGQWNIRETPDEVTVQRAYGDLTINCNKDKLSGSKIVNSATKGMAFGNVLLGGGIGAAVDVGTGAAYDYPSEITVELSKE